MWKTHEENPRIVALLVYRRVYLISILLEVEDAGYP